MIVAYAALKQYAAGDVYLPTEADGPRVSVGSDRKYCLSKSDFTYDHSGSRGIMNVLRNEYESRMSIC